MGVCEPTERQATIHTLHALMLIVFGFLIVPIFSDINFNSIWPHMATVKKILEEPLRWTEWAGFKGFLTLCLLDLFLQDCS